MNVQEMLVELRATAECLRGLEYSSGEGVEKDYVEAAKWYRKAAELFFWNGVVRGCRWAIPPWPDVLEWRRHAAG